VRHLNGEAVITAVAESVKGRVQVGDVIIAIDKESIADCSLRLGKYIAASTPQSLNIRLSRDLLRGQPDSICTLKVRGPDGSVRETILPRLNGPAFVAAMRELNGLRERTTPVFGLLPEGYGYFDLAKLTIPQIPAAFEAVKNTPALIMDMRGYPQGTSRAICSRLTDVPSNWAMFHCPYRDFPESVGVNLTVTTQIIPSSLWKYTQPIVVLIDENAVSQAEYGCQGFENAAKGRVTFVGTPTAGAGGDTTNTSMPGNIRISFSGQSVRQADGRQRQRLGIQPDIRVEPTIAGIVADKDEVLEAAVRFLNESQAKK
jgi:C-terminal processing protease CtpA/Prc